MRFLRFAIRTVAAVLPVALTVIYGLLVTSPAGEAARDYSLQVEPDPRVELAAILSRVAGRDETTPWPGNLSDAEVGARYLAQSDHPACRRVRRMMSQGLTPEMLVQLFLARGPWPGLDAGRPFPGPGITGASAHPVDVRTIGLTAENVDSLFSEVRDFAQRIRFDETWQATLPHIRDRAREIENDPTLRNLIARLTDFLGEPAVRRPTIIPTWYGSWKSPFASSDPEAGEIRVIDRAAGVGRITPETSLSWICVREFARPAVERLSRLHAAKTRELSGYWDYFRQGVAATTSTGWEDCLNAHLFRAIDLRVRPQQDGVERELRISSALSAGLGMIRVMDAAITDFDRSRGFYRKFTDYYPTLLESLVGLEARVRVEHPRLGLKVTPSGGGLRIDEILTGHSADGSDLKTGDVIVEADQRPVSSEEILAQIVQSHKLGDTIHLLVERDVDNQRRRVPIDLTLTKGRIEYEFFRPATPEPPSPASGRTSG